MDIDDAEKAARFNEIRRIIGEMRDFLCESDVVKNDKDASMAAEEHMLGAICALFDTTADEMKEIDGKSRLCLILILSLADMAVAVLR